MAQPKIRMFPLRVVLSVTTGRLLTKPQSENDNGISDLYDILGHMTSDQVWTHQLPRLGRECGPWLLRWYPQLAVASEWLGDLDERIWLDGAHSAIEAWLCEMEKRLGSKFAVGQIPPDDHDQIHPYDELVVMRGGDEWITL